jgi:beta-glucosidase
VGTSLKHYAANNQETERMRVSAQVSQRALREIYLPAFEWCVTQARPWTVMCAYNKVNGTYASEHTWLVTEVLRGEWGFEGLVVSDWGAVHDRVAALAAGLDLEMPPDLQRSPAALVAAVSDGRLAEADLDRSAARVLRLAARAPRPDPAPGFDAGAHHALARRAAGAGAVLLKNEAGLLPLDRPAAVAVIGAFARAPRYQGAGSSRVNPTRVENFPDELTARAGAHSASGTRPAASSAASSAATAWPAAWPARRSGPRPGRTRSSCCSACRTASSPRASTGTTSACPRTRSRCCEGWARRGRRSRCCSPPAAWSRWPAGRTTRPRSWSAGWAARPARRPPPRSCSARPSPAAGWP